MFGLWGIRIKEARIHEIWLYYGISFSSGCRISTNQRQLVEQKETKALKQTLPLFYWIFIK